MAFRPRPRPPETIGSDPAARYLPWIAGLMTFLSTLALALAFTVGAAVEGWDGELAHGATVQVPPAANGDVDQATVDAVVAELRASSAVSRAHVVPREETAALLRPWLGDGADVLDLPLPTVVNVELATARTPDLDALERRLERVAPGLLFDRHEDWFDRLARYAGLVEGATLASVGLIALVAVVTVIFMTLTRLAIHEDVIRLLHLMGASDAYVARLFERSALRMAALGASLGFLPAVVLILALDTMAAGLQGLLPVQPRLDALVWTALLAVPVAIILIAMASTRLTVLRTFARL